MRTLRAILLAALLIATPAVRAVDGEYTFGSASLSSPEYTSMDRGEWLPAFDATDLRVVLWLLAVDGSPSEEMAQHLFEAYSIEHLGMWPTAVETMERLHHDFEFSDSIGAYREYERELGELLASFRESEDAITERLVDDLRLVMGDVDPDAWSRAQAYLDRGPELLLGGVGSDRVDLVRLLALLEPDAEERASLAPAIEAYDGEMREALERRRPVLESLTDEVRAYQSVVEAGFEVETIEERDALAGRRDKAKENVLRIALRAREATERVSAVNATFKERFGALLTPDRRDEFADFSDDHLETPYIVDALDVMDAVRYHERLKALRDEAPGGAIQRKHADAIAPEPLSREQEHWIDSLMDELRSEVESLHEERPPYLLATIAERTSRFSLQTEDATVTVMFRAGSEDLDTADAWERYVEHMIRFSELDRAFVERLHDLLTVRQRAFLLTD